MQNKKIVTGISRIWHGWTSPENADKYESLLKNEIFVGIANKNIGGYNGIQLFRRQVGNEVEFVTIMQFNSLQSVKVFAGTDFEKAYVPSSARKILKRFDEKAQHYQVRNIESAVK